MRDNIFYNLYILITEDKDYYDETAIESYMERFSDTLSEIVYDVKKLRKGSKKTVPFAPFPSAPLIKMWRDYATYHQVRNTRLLDELIESMVRKVILIDIGTQMGGHTQMDPLNILNDAFDDTFDENFVERINDYLVDSRGTWLISDYGLNKMQEHVFQLLKPNQTPEQKLIIADQLLNVTHQRSDLAGWFVEGGKNSLDELFNG